jgi:hypothetical protein
MPNGRETGGECITDISKEKDAEKTLESSDIYSITSCCAADIFFYEAADIVLPLLNTEEDSFTAFLQKFKCFGEVVTFRFYKNMCLCKQATN